MVLGLKSVKFDGFCRPKWDEKGWFRRFTGYFDGFL